MTPPISSVNFRKPLKGIMSRAIRRGAHWAPARFWDFRNTVNGKFRELVRIRPKWLKFLGISAGRPMGAPTGAYGINDFPIQRTL